MCWSRQQSSQERCSCMGCCQGNSRNFVLVAQFGHVLTPRNLWSRYSSNRTWWDVWIYELDKMVTGEIAWNNRSLQESPMGLDSHIPAAERKTAFKKHGPLSLLWLLLLRHSPFPLSSQFGHSKSILTLQSLKGTQLFSIKCHLNVIWIKFIFARHKYHSTLY